MQHTFEQRCAFYGLQERHLDELRAFLSGDLSPQTSSIQCGDAEEKLLEPCPPKELVGPQVGTT